ncbi:MAG TPA: alpha/beta hydrolase [Steroidobacteraceae bacterium]|nr:alpha/beta hydrolase [Steroidobacteraceae bacterium]
MAWRKASLGLLLVLGAGLTWIGYQYHNDISRARARIASGSRLISTACGPIEYADTGAGPVILSIHGAGGGFDQGLALAEQFATRGYRVIAISRFGYLRTPAPPHPSIALQADAYACLLDELGIRRVAIVSASAGAPSALEFALRHSTRCTALVLLVPGWYPPMQRSFKRLGAMETLVFDRLLRSDFLFWAFTTFMPSVSDRAVLGTPPSVMATASAADRVRVATILRDISPVSARQVGLSLEGKLTAQDLSKLLESITAPTLAISTEDDLYSTYANAEFITHHIPQSEFVGYHTGGHMLVGHSEEITFRVLAFLHHHSADLLAQ